MNVLILVKKVRLSFFAVAILVFCFGAISAQTVSVKKKRLKNQATVQNLVGGEAHDGYVIRARRNQTLQIHISWQAADDNKVQFVVSRSADFYAGDVLGGGTETDDGKNWSVKVPATADYYIYVTAYPAAKYTLKVSVR